MNASKFVAFSKPRKATIVATATALLLVAVKLTVGLLTGTVTVMASAADSLLDFLVSSFNVFAVHNTERPTDASYNYGRGKIEGVAAALEGLFILASALYILREAVLKIVTPTAITDPQLLWALAAMGFSMAATLVLTLYLRRLSAVSPSLVVKADSVHYQTDLLTNGGIVIALGAIRFTGWVWLDPAIGIAISIYVAQAAIPLLRKGLQMLLDRALEDDIVAKIRKIALGHNDRVTGVHELKTRRSGDTHFVEFHLVFDENIRLREAHSIADEIETKVRGLGRARWVINIHLDPVDDSYRDRKLSGGNGEE